jgi:hypothetical protein
MAKHLLIIILLIIPTNALATDYTVLGKTMHYIRSGATGSNDGTDWTNAWSALPSTLTRDHVYFIADGTYASYDMDDGVSGSQYIYIVKATADDHGTETGWSSTYGDGQALFTTSSDVNTIYITTDYWIVDGQYRSDWDSSYGFKFSTTVSTGSTIVKLVRLASGVDNVTTTYCEMQHRGDGIADVGDDVFYYTGSHSNIRIAYCYLRDASKNGAMMIGTDNIFEYNLMEEIQSAGSTHGQGLYLFGSSSNINIRYNVFKDVKGTGTIGLAWGTDGIYIHGNVFWQTDPAYRTTNATIFDISDPGETGVTNMLVFNNTWYKYDDSVGGNPGVSIYLTSDASTNKVQNNIFIDCEAIQLAESNGSHDYNHFINSDFIVGFNLGANESSYSETGTLTDPENFDFSLASGKTPIDAGATLGSPWSSVENYNVDGEGSTRGGDGSWDMGAFEFGSASAPTLSGCVMSGGVIR